MKKLFMLILSAALLMTMSIGALAAFEGSIFEYDGSSLEIISGDLVPGKTYYIGLEANKPKDSKAKLSYTCTQVSNDKKFSIATTTSLPIAKRKYASDYAYFAELKLKDIPASSYHEDGFLFDGTVTYRPSGTADGGTGNATITKNCAYPAGSGSVYDYQTYHYYSDEGEVELDVDGTDVTIEFNTAGVEYKLLLAMDTKFNETLANKYPNAYLDFYNGNGATFKSARPAIVTIPREGTQYLYEYSGSTLKAITTRNSDGDFEFKTTTLGKYVVSDTKLGAEVIPTPTPTITPGLTPPYGGHFNPGTGACA